MAITKTQGKDFNFFKKVDVTSAVFVDGTPDIIITFSNRSLFFMNEGTGVVEYSFNGNTVHGELDSTKDSKTLKFDNRTSALIWFRVKSGSSGPITVRVDAW